MAMSHCSFRPPGRRARGFSLVEILVAFFLLGVAIIVTLSILSGSARAEHGSRLDLAAALAAQAGLDQEVRLPFASVASVPLSTSTVSFGQRGEEEKVVLSTVVTVSSVSSTCKDVVVTVTWTDDGRARNYTLETLVSNVP